MRRALLLVLALAAACAAPPATNRELERMSRDYQRHQAEQEAAAQTPPPAAPAGEDSCGLAQNQHLVGMEEGQFQTPANARVICFGCMATMDYSASRLTIQIGPGHKVASLRCG